VIKHENCKNTLFNKTNMLHKVKSIRSENHKIYSIEINKKSCFDDKRYILVHMVIKIIYAIIKMENCCQNPDIEIY